MVKSMASGLHEIGISQGDVVLVLLPKTLYFPVILLGILSIGAIVTTMNPLSSKGVETHGTLISMIELLVLFEASQYKNPGSTIVAMRKFDPNEMVRAIDGYEVTHFLVVPPILMSLMRLETAGSSNLSSLKQVTCGAAPLS
ncbi:hypothetical protein HHK36_022250 [Tetracentron sinense]|uniref:4-coumarate--CoA ligase n=1 Tax=Tetracentron sinense TaxID=13715 RepID=A0A834YPH5_TETSI|nr:hypothetical protein HHK36_022250 [Tetracentron sinense]